MRGSDRLRNSLRRNPREAAVGRAALVGFIFAFLPLIPCMIVLVPQGFFMGWYDAVEVFVGGVVTLFGLHAIVSILFGLLFRLSFDQFKMLMRLLLIVDVGMPPLLAACVAFSAYVANVLGAVSPILRVPERFVVLASVVGFMFILVVVTSLFDDRISRWYHMKPISEVGALKQAPRSVADADRRLKAGEFEGASQEFADAAKLYLSVEDWSNAGKHYWLAAETLSKDSADLSFGVATLYTLSAAAYFLCGDVAKAGEAIERTKEIVKDQEVDDRETISLILEILEVIKAGDMQLMQEEPIDVLQWVKELFGPYGEEMTLLVEKNFERIQQRAKSD